MSKASRKPSGRPRRLSLDQVLAEAMAMGVDNIEMAPLAKRLGVAVGTLYSYVNSREHLIFQIASKMSEAAVVKDRGQCWQEIVREHAWISYNRLQGWPQLIVNLVTGSAGTHFGADTRRHMVSLLVNRGLTRKLADRLYFETTQIVFGAIVATHFLDSTIRPLCVEGQDLEAFGFPKEFGGFQPGLERLILSVETEKKKH